MHTYDLTVLEIRFTVHLTMCWRAGFLLEALKENGARAGPLGCVVL